MKSKLIPIIALCTLYLCSAAQTLPEGKRLKNINPAILIGTTFQTGFSDTKELVIANSDIQTIFKREFNLGQTTCYPAWYTWKGLKDYDFTPFNQTVNWNLETMMLNFGGQPNQSPFISWLNIC